MIKEGVSHVFQEAFDSGFPNLDSNTGRAALAYDPNFDTKRVLDAYEIEDPIERVAAIERTRDYMRTQMISNIGERLNAGMFETSYDVRDGVMYGKGMDASMVDVVKRGRDYRRHQGTSVDWGREDAEFVSMNKIQSKMIDKTTPIGSMMVLISPPGQQGSSYQKNFYDMFVKKSEGEIEYFRYSSGLSVKEYQKRFGELGINIRIPEDVNPDEYLLANPIYISEEMSRYITPDSLHKHLHLEHDALTRDEYQQIVSILGPFIDAYSDAIIKNPKDIFRRNLSYNAILNKADDIYKKIKLRKNGENIVIEEPLIFFDQSQIELWGTKEVEDVMQGCGSSGGMDLSNPWSVKDFGNKKDWEYHTGTCRICEKSEIEVGPCQICKKCEAKFDAE